MQRGHFIEVVGEADADKAFVSPMSNVVEPRGVLIGAIRPRLAFAAQGKAGGPWNLLIDCRKARILCYRNRCEAGDKQAGKLVESDHRQCAPSRRASFGSRR